MAAADKLYLTIDEYKELKPWWLANREKMKQELGHELWMYPFDMLSKYDYSNGFDDAKKIYDYDPSESDLDFDWWKKDDGTYSEEALTVFNLSTKDYCWLWYNCPIESVSKAAEKHLVEYWYQDIPDKLLITQLRDQIDFSEPDRVWSIIGKNTTLHFFNENEAEEVTYHEEMLVMGTTFVFKLLHDVLDNIQRDDDYHLYFTWCGIHLVYKKEGLFNAIGDEDNPVEVIIPFLRLGNLGMPKLKFSFDFADADNYGKDQIIMSMEDAAWTMDQYKEELPKRRLMLEFPGYIRDHMERLANQ